MLVAIEGSAGSGKSTIRDRLLTAAGATGVPLAHIGQFSWLSLAATRTIVGLRAGNASIGESEALAAVAMDLDLHVRHNIASARQGGHVVADRLVLSTACLLALVYRTKPDEFIVRLASVEGARPSLTVVLTTPPEISSLRLDGRRSARRFGDEPDAIARLTDLYGRAAEVWHRETGAEVLTGASLTLSDADRFVAAVLARLR
jgi:thymidylate kinase